MLYFFQTEKIKENKNQNYLLEKEVVKLQW